MKTVSIQLDHDPDSSEPLKEFELDCHATLRGRYFYDCLLDIFDILQKYDKNKKLTEDQQKVLDDIRKKCAANFRGIYYDV